MSKSVIHSLLPLLAAALCACTGSSTQVETGNFYRQFDLEVVAREATPFALDDVRLLDGPFKQAQSAEVAYLLSLDPDRLLHRFHKHAGLPVKGEIYGGWEQRGLSGHSLGHYLSACAMMYTATGDEKLKTKLDYTITELARCQNARGTGYVGAIPLEDSVFADVAAGNINSSGFDLNGAWVPWYNIHKTMAGLNDAYIYTGNEQALKVNVRFANWIQMQFKDLDEAQFQRMLNCEHGGMNEALADMYALTGDKTYLAYAKKFNHHSVLDPITLGQDKLAGLHANTQIPKVIGRARQYELSANSPDSAAAAFFFRQVVNHHSYVIGGNSEHEHFGEPDALSARLSKGTAEGCNTYNMLKLARHLFGWKALAKYMDYYEIALYNHILASIRPNDGMVCYFMPLESGTFKEYGTPFDSFWCCTGTGMENPAKYGESIYFKGSDGSLILNLFIPSTLHWKERDMRIEMRTRFPLTENVELEITEGNAEFPLQIRKPSWLASEATIKVNGESIQPGLNANGYLVIDRSWKKGDKVELNLPMALYVKSMPDDSTHIAFMNGPLVLAANVDGYSEKIINGEAVLLAESKGTGSLKPGSSPMEYVVKAECGPLSGATIKPFYQFQGEPHVVYWKQFSNSEWAQKKTTYEAEMARRAAFEAATIDVLRIGEMQPERDHKLRSENSITGEAFGQKYRHAQNGWFEFDMKVSQQPTELMVTYWGGDDGGRTFNISIEGKVIATETLNGSAPNSFIDRSYVIPASLKQNKDSVTVRFEALPGNIAGGVYGIRTILKPIL